MWDSENQEYFWIVLCKNYHYHRKQSQAAGHPILLGETDSVSPPPNLEEKFAVTCDDCGTEYLYRPRDVVRFETEPPESFSVHPLFADFDSVPTTQQPVISAPSFRQPVRTAPSFGQVIKNLFQRPRRYNKLA